MANKPEHNSSSSSALITLSAPPTPPPRVPVCGANLFSQTMIPSSSQLPGAKWVTRGTGCGPDDAGRTEAEIGTLSQGETGADSDPSVAAPTENSAACASADDSRTRFSVQLYSEGLDLILVQFSKAPKHTGGAQEPPPSLLSARKATLSSSLSSGFYLKVAHHIIPAFHLQRSSQNATRERTAVLSISGLVVGNRILLNVLLLRLRSFHVKATLAMQIIHEFINSQLIDFIDRLTIN